MQYILHYDYAALAILLTVMLHYFIKKNVNTSIKRRFTLLLCFAFASAVLDILDSYTITYVSILPRELVIVVKQCYLIVFNGTAALYYWYIMSLTRGRKQLNMLENISVFLPIGMDVVMILTNPLSEFVFRFDRTGHYSYGPGMYVLYGIAFLYLVMGLLQTYQYRHMLTLTQKGSVYFFTISNIAAVLFQMINTHMIISTFSVALSMLLIYLSLENPESYEDKRFGTLNREAFTHIVTESIDKNREFNVLGIQVDGFKYINDIIGVTNGDQLLKTVADYLMQIAGEKNVYHLSGVQFAILRYGIRGDIQSYMDQISRRFEKPFVSNGIEVQLNVPMCYLSYPENVRKLEDVMDTIEYSLKESGHENNSCIVYASDEILKRKRRETEVIQLIKTACKKEGFEVFYQPIYSVEEEKFTSAEALIRLRDSQLGYVSPEEFIPLAEKNGLILQIGEFVFEQVCRLISEEHLDQLGIHYIEVNLSVIQCMQENLSKTLLAIMDHYQVSSEQINLEITETAATVSSDTLLENMEELIGQGTTFSMDDYGTGFSNSAHMIKYPFSMIKFDKSMIWSAMDSDKAMRVLKHNFAMVRDLGLSIVAEGVERKEQADILKKLGCDYFQGYYYSKPIPEKEFLEYLKLHNRER